MRVYIKRKNNTVNAIAEYNIAEKSFVVLKGSKVSDSIAYSTSFRGSKSIEKSRANGNVINGIVAKDVVFKSPSTAANFVTGTSTNGLVTWKDKNGTPLKDLLNKEGAQ